ncbi:DUF4375 domain-containing protein [uncultured Flavobacterium sp.]|uniref:DMP19 family protein n=1 Tax=uncultured Flavobacterium sp. TaxID=165435 RepID=UPI0030CA2FFC
MSNIDKILALTDEIEIIEAVGTSIWDKKQTSNDITLLTDGERTFVYIDVFEAAMNEGGFNHFFSSESGNFAQEIKAAYTAIKAPKSALLVEKALGLFPKNSYVDHLDKRNNLLAKMDDKIFSGWEDLDEIFFNEEQTEDIVDLIVAYIRTHKNEFN